MMTILHWGPRWKVGICMHCKGSVYFEEDGDVWVCINCARRMSDKMAKILEEERKEALKDIRDRFKASGLLTI